MPSPAENTISADHRGEPHPVGREQRQDPVACRARARGPSAAAARAVPPPLAAQPVAARGGAHPVCSLNALIYIHDDAPVAISRMAARRAARSRFSQPRGPSAYRCAVSGSAGTVLRPNVGQANVAALRDAYRRCRRCRGPTTAAGSTGPSTTASTASTAGTTPAPAPTVRVSPTTCSCPGTAPTWSAWAPRHPRAEPGRDPALVGLDVVGLAHGRRPAGVRAGPGRRQAEPAGLGADAEHAGPTAPRRTRRHGSPARPAG